MKPSTKRLFLLPAILLVIILFAVSGCVTVQQPSSQTQEPSNQSSNGNRPPIISGLTAANNQLYPSGTTEVQVVAADPDGDNVDISWQYTGGNINGAGYVVTWQAPKDYGNYTITAVASDGKGGSAQQSITISVGANQSPQITSLAAKPQTVGYTQQSIITCTASDPDGDVVKYNWEADEGSITGGGPTVTWKAPSKEGTFNVYVTVTDGKGGESMQNVAITVAGTTKTVTLTVIKEETGTVSSDGNRDTSIMKAGDDQKGIGYRAFFSFNIFSLNRAEIKDAKLQFTTRKIVGNPFLAGGSKSLNGLLLRKVQYTDMLPSFNIIGTALQRAAAAFTQSPNIVDVTPEVAYGVSSGSDRFQISAAFDKITNGDDVAEWIEWTDVTMQVTYAEK